MTQQFSSSRQDMKFYCQPEQQMSLGVLSQENLQLFDFDGTKLARKTLIDIPEINCFDWLAPKVGDYTASPQILAGTNLGEILQISFTAKPQQTRMIYQPYNIEKRLVCKDMLRTQRHCYAIAQNKQVKHLIAAGYQQGGERGQSCLLVWDLSYQKRDAVPENRRDTSVPPKTAVGQLVFTQSSDHCVEPKHEFKEVNDDVNAVAWLPNSHTEILVATEDDLSLCDIRSTWTVQRFIEEGHCKHVTSIKFDPFDTNRFATQSADQIKIFDLRNRRRPLFILKDSGHYRQFEGFEWTQYRSDLIAAFSENSLLVKFWDINQRGRSEVITQEIQPLTQIKADSGDISALAWRPQQSEQDADAQNRNKFYVLTRKEGIIEEHFFGDQQHHVFAMSSRGQICFSGKDFRTLKTVSIDVQFNNFEPDQLKKFDKEILKQADSVYQVAKNYTCEISSNQGSQLRDISFLMIERLKAGYRVDSINLNLALSNRFQYLNKKYSKKHETAVHNAGISVFWEWLQKLQQSESREFLAGIQLPLQDDSTKEKLTSLNGKLVLYKSEWRKNIIKFCGWLDQQGLAKKQEQNKILADVCGQIVTRESEIQGSKMRAVVMAALHQDYELAQELGSNSETRTKYGEDATNIMHFSNHLSLLGKATTSQNLLETQTANIFVQVVKNPYLRLFYQLMLETDLKKVLEDCARSNTSINTFDFVTLACKFLDYSQFKTVLSIKIEQSISKGNLDVLPLIGILPNQSKQIQRLLQNFIDNTADVQTASYVAAYAASAAQLQRRNPVQSYLSESKAQDPLLVPYKRFIQSYRDYLNRLSLYHARAQFDCLHNKGLLQVIMSNKQNDVSSLQSQFQVPKVDNSKFETKNNQPEAVLLSDPFETRPFVTLAKCGICYKPFSVKQRVLEVLEKPATASKNNLGRFLEKCSASTGVLNTPCQAKLPSCAVCLRSLTLLNPNSELRKSSANAQNQQEELNHNIDQWMLWCQICRHGGHAGHIRDWFKTQTTCPLSSCDCQCNNSQQLI